MTKVLGALLALFFLGWPITATAQATACAPRDQIIEYTETKYGEKRVIRALTKSNKILEVYVNEDGTSWTVFLTNLQGITCAVEAGDDLEIIPQTYGDPS